jgi:hypothetical protein
MRWTWIGMAVVTSLTVWVVSAVVYASWLKHEAQKARRESEQRKTLDRIVQASMPPPAAPGLNRTRVS